MIKHDTTIGEHMIVIDIKDADFAPVPFPTALTVGNFDGVHRGHAALIDACRADACRRNGVKVAAFTFSTNTHLPSGSESCLCDAGEKERTLESLGVEVLFRADFSAVCGISAEEFATEWIVRRLRAVSFFCGEDFRYGKGRGGTAQTLCAALQAKGIRSQIIPDALYRGEKISSTAIRALLFEGQIEDANGMLGYSYRLQGTVIHGDGLGRVLGYPTANLSVGEGKLLPAHGVYCTRVQIGGECFDAVTNVGVRPTVTDAGTVSVESYLLCAPQPSLYGKEMTLTFLHRIRREIPFPSADALTRQIRRDTEYAQDYFVRNPITLI